MKRQGFVKKNLEVTNAQSLAEEILKATETTPSVTPTEPQKNNQKEGIKRINADLPLDIWEQVEAHIKNEGYTLKGFLTKVLRDYFKQ